ncbi:MAG: YIP1 family protein [Rubricella sp.]
MSRTLFAQILSAWVDPRAEMERQLAAGHGEPRALMYVMLAGVMVFITGLPSALYDNLQAGAPYEPSGIATSWLITAVAFMTLLRYLVAVIARWVAKPFGGKGTHFTARLAFFWSSLAVAPALIVSGSVAGVAYATGNVVLLWLADITGIAAQFLLLWLWVRAVEAAEGFERVLPAAGVVALTLLVLALLIGIPVYATL